MGWEELPSPGAGAMISGGTLVGSVGDGLAAGGAVVTPLGGGGLSAGGATGEVVVSVVGAASVAGLLQAIRARVVPAAMATVRKVFMKGIQTLGLAVLTEPPPQPGVPSRLEL